jgi:hypothetical protein
VLKERDLPTSRNLERAQRVVSDRQRAQIVTTDAQPLALALKLVVLEQLHPRHVSENGRHPGLRHHGLPLHGLLRHAKGPRYLDPRERCGVRQPVVHVVALRAIERCGRDDDWFVARRVALDLRERDHILALELARLFEDERDADVVGERFAATGGGHLGCGREHELDRQRPRTILRCEGHLEAVVPHLALVAGQVPEDARLARILEAYGVTPWRRRRDRDVELGAGSAGDRLGRLRRRIARRDGLGKPRPRDPHRGGDHDRRGLGGARGIARRFRDGHDPRVHEA